MYKAVKKKFIYQSPVVLQQAEVLLELAFLLNSGDEPDTIIQNSEIKAGYSTVRDHSSYSGDAWLD